MRIEKANPQMSLPDRLAYHSAEIIEGIVNIPLSFFGLIFDGWSFDIILRSAKKQAIKALKEEEMHDQQIEDRKIIYHDITCNCYLCRDGKSHRAKD